MFVSYPHSLYGILRRPLVCILLFFIVLVIVFVALLPNPSASRLLENFALLPPQHQVPRPPLHSSPFISSHLGQLSHHRIKVQLLLAEPGHDGPWAQRADAVRGAFLHAYRGYLTHTAPHDELCLLTNSSVDKCVCPRPRLAAAPVE
jgi:hypothetical protein